MWTGVMSVVAVCVVLVAVLFCLRKKPILKRTLPPGVAIAVIAGIVVVAGVALHWVVMHPPQYAASAGGEGGDPEAMMAGGMGGGGGWGEPSPARDLSQLVRKMAELQKHDAGTFSQTQQAALLPILCELRDAEKLPDEEAGATNAAIQALLVEAQQEALAAVELPRRGRGGGGRGRGGPGGVSGGSAPGDQGSPQPEPASPPPAEGSSLPAEAPSPGVAGQAPPTPGGTGGPGGAGGSGGRSGFRDRLLQIPAVKEAYDAKVSEDPTFAENSEAQRGFFRSIMREISPFQRSSAKEAVETLIAAFGGQAPGQADDSAAPTPEATQPAGSTSKGQ